MMNISTTTTALFCIALVGILQSDVSTSVDAFSLSIPTSANSVTTFSSTRTATATATRTTTMLSMAEEDEATEGAESGDDDAAAEVEEEDQGPPEDPEVTALKESIAKLESNLAGKKSKIQYELEQCEEYSKSGYARKVADMENMKRVRSVSIDNCNLYIYIYILCVCETVCLLSVVVCSCYCSSLSVYFID